MTAAIGSVVALEQGWSDTVEAEHGALAGAAVLGRPVASACTHVASGPDGVPRVVVTLELSDLDGRRETPPSVGQTAATRPSEPPFAQHSGVGYAAQVSAHAGRTGGRAFRFPGWEELTGVLTVAELVARSGIDEVAVVGGAPPAPDARVDTQGFVRPLYRGGRLVLHLRRAVGGGYVPFEQPDPIPCCTDHAIRTPRTVEVTPG